MISSSNQRLINLVDNHINNECFTWNQIDETDQEILAVAAMADLGDDAYVCITESDYINDIMSELRKHMLTGNNSYDLSIVMTKAAVKYFEKDLIKLFAERRAYHDDAINYEAGLTPYINKQTGEQEWIRHA